MSLEDLLGRFRTQCEVCEGKLEHPPGAGRPKKYCGKKCARKAHLAQRREQYAEIAAEHVKHEASLPWCPACRFNAKRRKPDGRGHHGAYGRRAKVAVCNTRPSTVIFDPAEV